MTSENQKLKEKRKPFAVYVITKHGFKTALLFKKAHPECDSTSQNALLTWLQKVVFS